MKQKLAEIFHRLGFSVEGLNTIAKDNNFKKRKRILDAFDFLFAVLVNANKEIISYNTMASTLALQKDKAVSKQALHKAMNKVCFFNFINEVLDKLLARKLGISGIGSRFGFKRIIIQDSTVIKLPGRLASLYSGVKNGFVQVVNAHIQYAFDVLTSHCVFFDLNPYAINDAKAAGNIHVRKGDLILRDRGYFSLTEVKRLLNNEVDFIYRYKHGIIYYDAETGMRLNLAKILYPHQVTDIKVRVDTKNGPIIRLLAEPVSEELANQRRAKLKKESKTFPSKEILALLSWSIFLTTIDKEKADFKNIFELYSLRWRIETMFKAMKSHLKLDKIHNVSNTQLKFIITAKMISFLLIFQFIFSWFGKKISTYFDRELSLFKLCRFLQDNLVVLADLIEQTCRDDLQRQNNATRMLLKYCTYDKRKRLNYNSRLNQFS